MNSELENPFDNGVSDRERLWAIGVQMILDQYGDDQS